MNNLRRLITCGMVLIGTVLTLNACTNLTEPQHPSQALITTVPENGATNVPTDTTIMAQFLTAQDIDEESLTTNNVWLIKEGVEPVSVQLQYSPNEQGGTLQLLAGNLENATNYVVVLGDGITVNGLSLDQVLHGQTDLASQHLAGDGGGWGRGRTSAPQQEISAPGETAQPSGLSFSVKDFVGQPAPLANQETGQPAAEEPTVQPGIVGQFQNVAYSWSFTTAGETAPDLAAVDESCAATTDCEVGLECLANKCTDPNHCSNSTQDGDESDVDCGGSCAEKCADTFACETPDDCQSGVCEAGICQAPSCLDSVKNGLEGDVDCGGVCPSKCADGLSCNEPTDCESGTCTENLCVAVTCSDSVQNGEETDVDCGGSVCLSCDDDKGCLAHSDCRSGNCQNSTCVAATCDDAIVNGSETDIDCGGDTCDPCNLGQMCSISADCLGSLECVGGHCETSYVWASGFEWSGAVKFTLPADIQPPAGALVDATDIEALRQDTGQEPRAGFSSQIDGSAWGVAAWKALDMYGGVVSPFADLRQAQPAPGCSFFVQNQPPDDKFFGPVTSHDLAFNPGVGVSLAAWTQKYSSDGHATAASEQGVFARFIMSTGVENTLQVLDSTSQLGDPYGGVRAAMNRNGDAIVVYTHHTATDYTVGARYYSAHTSWADADQLVVQQNSLRDPVIAISDAGKAVAAWVSDNKDIYFAHYDGDQWQDSTQLPFVLDHLSAVTDMEVASDSGGNFVLVWTAAEQVTPGGHVDRSIWWAMKAPGQGWTDPALLTEGNAVTGHADPGEPSHPQIATDGYGHSIVVWEERADSRENNAPASVPSVVYTVALKRFVATDPSTIGDAVVLESGRHTANPQVAIHAATGSAIVVWRTKDDTNFYVKGSFFDPTAQTDPWSQPITLSSLTATVWDPAVAVHPPTGTILVLWRQNGATPSDPKGIWYNAYTTETGANP